MIIGILDTEYYTFNHYIIQAVCNSLKRDRRVTEARLIHDEKLTGDISVKDFDVIICVGNAANVHWRVPRWKSAGIITVFWSTEDPYQLSDNIKYAQDFDLIFSNDLASLPLYGGRAKHLPLAGSLEDNLLAPRPDEKLDNDILFIGSAWPNRVELVNDLKSRLDRNVRVKIALPVNPHIPAPIIDDDDLIWNWRTSPNGFARLANRSRLVLTLGRTYSGLTDVVHGSTPPPRIFEVGLAGTPQIFITQSREIDRYYDDGVHLFTRPSLDEAMPEIHRLLDDGGLRGKMARAIHEHSKKYHCYDNRSAEILDAVVSLKKEADTNIVQISSYDDTFNIDKPVDKTRILVVAHNLLGKNPGGGVEVYLDALKRYASKEFDVYYLTAVNLNGRTIINIIFPDGISLHHETSVPFSSHMNSQPQIEDFLFKFIINSKIDLVHFHHILNLPFSLPHVATLAGAKTVFTAHDYYLICDNFTLISYDNKFCDFTKKSMSYCDLCLRNTKGVEIGSQSVRRNVIQRTIDQFDALVFNTPYSLNLFNSTYRVDANKCHVIEMAQPDTLQVKNSSLGQPAKGRRGPDVLDAEEDHPLIVKIAGNFTREKGGFELFNVMDMMRSENVEFHILGREDSRLSEMLDAAQNPAIIRHRGYHHAELPGLLAGGDVSINYSIWPETYMISLSEAWSAGLAPIVSDLGAPAERVSDYEDGFIVPAGDIGALLERIRELLYDRKLLSYVRENVARKKIQSMRSHANELFALYNGLTIGFSHNVPHGPQDRTLIYDRLMLGERNTANIWNRTSALWDSEYNQADLHVVPVNTRVHEYPLSDIPLEYNHLSKTSVDQKLSHEIILLDARVAKYVNNKSIFLFTYQINPLSNKQLVESYISCKKDEILFVYPLFMNKMPDGRIHVNGSLPYTMAPFLYSIISVHDSVIISYDNIDKFECLDENIQNEPDEVVLENDDLLIEPNDILVVEGCDRITGVQIKNNCLVIKGWGIDPLGDYGMVPGKVAAVVSDGAQFTKVISAFREADLAIAALEPIYGFSGLQASVSIAALVETLPNANADLAIYIVQETPDGWITSGTLASLPAYKLAGKDGAIAYDNAVRPETTNSVEKVLQKFGPENASFEKLADEILWMVDIRLFVEKSAKEKLNLHDKSNLIKYYIINGDNNNYIASPSFNPITYKKYNPEIAKFRPLIMHYVMYGSKEGRKSFDGMIKNSDAIFIDKYIDHDYYIKNNFGNSEFSGDIASHYVAFGEDNDFRPNADFDPRYYRSANPDVAYSGVNLLSHYVRFGKKEGRKPYEGAELQSPHRFLAVIVRNLFDVEFYVSQAPYIKGTDIDPVCHYFEFGIDNNLFPNRSFKKKTSKDISKNDVISQFVQLCLENMNKDMTVE